jgi:hypothetical protein
MELSGRRGQTLFLGSSQLLVGVVGEHMVAGQQLLADLVGVVEILILLPQMVQQVKEMLAVLGQTLLQTTAVVVAGEQEVLAGTAVLI